MNQSKIIEFSKSTLISLKAELLRKQDEVSKAKLEPKNQINNFVPSSRFEQEKETPTKAETKKPTIDAEEAEALRKSKESLERKSKLYEHLSEGLVSNNEENYLVNFRKKAGENKRRDDSTLNDDTPDSDRESDEKNSEKPDLPDDDEWVDFEDCLGRVRRCHKSDLENYKEQDKELRESLHPSEKKSSYDEKQWVKEGSSRVEEPTDEYKEMLKKQWEEKERELLNKDTVFYEDVLFNEARTHGVGYYALSGDEKVREQQQAELKKLHEETERARVAASEAKAKREHALQLRVKAARARQRARAGLPPEEENEPDPTQLLTAKLLDFVEEQKKISAENASKEREAKEAEAKKKREKFVREWDMGKEDLEKRRHKVMSQEEWVDKKRQERPKEFAPPQSSSYKNKNSTEFDNRGYVENNQKERTWENVRPGIRPDPILINREEDKSQSLYFTTKKRKEDIKSKYYDPSVNKDETFEPVPIRDELEEEDESNTRKSKSECKKGAEIEPPPTYEYYGPANRKRKREDEKKIDVGESFQVGLQLLKEKADKKGKRKPREFTEDF